MDVETVADQRVSRLVRGRMVVNTHGEGLTDLSPAIHAWLRSIGPGEGMVNAFVRHTTASLTIQENADADVQRDLVDALGRIAPVRGDYRHGLEGPDDMPAHIKAVVCGASIDMPYSGALCLGTWQSLYLVEHRAGRRRREVLFTYLGS